MQNTVRFAQHHVYEENGNITLTKSDKYKIAIPSSIHITKHNGLIFLKKVEKRFYILGSAVV